MEMKLLKVELDIIDCDAAPNCVVYLHGMTIVQNFVATCLLRKLDWL